MERDFGAELDLLKNDLDEIKQLLTTLTSPKAKNTEPPQRSERILKAKNLHSDPDILSILSRLEDTCNRTGQSGAIAYVGVYESGGQQSTWISGNVDTDTLLGFIDNKTAVHVLSCVGNSDRLNMLRAFLKKPMTVAQLVEECGYSSTGQVYHHLKTLISADLIREDYENAGRGVYTVLPYRIQGILMLLAGVSDMTNPKYSRGDWRIVE